MVSGVCIDAWMERNWERRAETSAVVKEEVRRRSKPRGWGVVCAGCWEGMSVLVDMGFCEPPAAASSSLCNSWCVRVSPIEQFMYIRGGTGSGALPLPFESDGGGGGDGGDLR